MSDPRYEFGPPDETEPLGGLVGRVEQLLELAGKATPRPWFLVVNDLVGGLSAATVDKPLSAIEMRSQDELVPADFLSRDTGEFLVAAVNLVEPLARDWQRLKRIEEAARASFPAIERYYFGEVSHKASAAFDEAVVALREALAAVSGEPE